MKIKKIILISILISFVIFTVFRLSTFPLRSYHLREAAIEKVLSENNNIRYENVVIENHYRKNGIAIFAGKIDSKEPKLFLVAFESFWISPFYSKALYSDDSIKASLSLIAKPLDYEVNYSENSDNFIEINQKFNPKHLIMPIIFTCALLGLVSIKEKSNK